MLVVQNVTREGDNRENDTMSSHTQCDGHSYQYCKRQMHLCGKELGEMRMRSNFVLVSPADNILWAQSVV